ncbi:hypothetical protein CRUP_019426, partial [Coryphaenoides rupestris]
MLATLYDCFWWDRIWLPVNLTWADLEDQDGRVYAKASHLYVTVPYAVAFLLVRFAFERFVATPFAASLGIKERVHLAVADNPVLEAQYQSRSRNPGPGNWRFVFYLCTSFGGILALYDKEWFYDTRQVWTGFPKQDFKEQIIHHLATLTLLAFSWCVNYIRIGTMVMLVHDTSDVLLESAKLFNYAKWERTCNALFVVFAIVFMVTRLIIFPFWLIHCTWVYPVLHFPPFFGYYFFNVMLVVLLFLHIFWAYLILRMQTLPTHHQHHHTTTTITTSSCSPDYSIYQDLLRGSTLAGPSWSQSWRRMKWCPWWCYLERRTHTCCGTGTRAGRATRGVPATGAPPPATSTSTSTTRTSRGVPTSTSSTRTSRGGPHLHQHHTADEDHLLLLLPAFGDHLYLNLRRDNSFLSDDFVAEERERGKTPKVSRIPQDQLCFYTGWVVNHTDSYASLSTCGGL